MKLNLRQWRQYYPKVAAPQARIHSEAGGPAWDPSCVEEIAGLTEAQVRKLLSQ
jgi:hypothetical protein